MAIDAMVLIEWRDEFKTGIAAVDYEHESMIGLLNDLYAGLGTEASAEEIEDFLGEVYARIQAHFALEEKMMRAAGYDQYADHKSDHDHLLDEIRDIMDRHHDGGYENYDEDLASQLKSWFVDHFRYRDSRLHKVLG
ncbi:MAG: bacteriohemerythrin [Alphaproteobacteria bacterium]|nr:bacteriohemerythrin [Alphaproteobacteria bacterium]